MALTMARIEAVVMSGIANSKALSARFATRHNELVLRNWALHMNPRG